MVNQLCFKKSDFVSEEDMYIMITTQIKLLLWSNHTITVFNDKENGQVIIKFAYIDPSKKLDEQDEKFPYWLFPEEAKALFELNRLAQVEAFKQMMDNMEDGLVDEELVDDDMLPLLPSKPSKNEA